MKKKTLSPLLKMGLASLLLVFMLNLFTIPVHAAPIKKGNVTYTAKTTGTYPNIKTSIYSQKKGSAQKKLATVSGTAYLQFIYGNNLYFEKDTVDDPTLIDFWALNLKTRKITKIRANAAVTDRYGKYVVLAPNTGALVPLPCFTYNAQTGKIRKLSNNCIRSCISDKKIYYAQTSGDYRSGWSTRIYRANLTGYGKKAISGSFKSNGVYKINSKCVYYGLNGKYYQYTFSSGKTKQVNYQDIFK